MKNDTILFVSFENFATFEPDGITPVYFKTARAHEVVFRGVLSHLRSVFLYYPKNIDDRVPLDDLLDLCHPKSDHESDIFSVADFLVGPREDSKIIDLSGGIADNEALIAFTDFVILSGSSSIHKYDIANQTPTFKNAIFVPKD